MASTTVTVILIFAAIVLLFSMSLADAIRGKRTLKKRLIDSWGKKPQANYQPGDFQSIASYSVNRKKEDRAAFRIDDVTWHDLDMDQVFMLLNGTESTIGEEYLYRMLREPALEPEPLRARRDLISYFGDHPDERLAIQIILSKLGKKRQINVTDYFYDPAIRPSRKAISYKFLSSLALLAPLLLLLNTGLGVLLIAVSFLTNMVVYYRMHSEIAFDLGRLSYIVRMVRSVRKLTTLNVPGVSEISSRLRSCLGKIATIEKRAFYLLYIGTGSVADIAVEYIKIILLRELIDYEYLLKTVCKHRKALIETYDAVGLIDSMITIASYRESVPFYTEPILVEYSPGKGRHLDFEEIYHPLMDNAVPNSLNLDHSVLITGSNASGKSTLLKAVAINAIFAQCIGTCLARQYRSNYFAIFTSMALRDNVRNGESYFIAEIKSIKRIIDYLNDGVPCLCLIDEVLRGTNTVERIAASSQVLLWLASHNCICMAATHDIELTYILAENYENIHFQETITQDAVAFDYKLYSGRATSRNALRLLKLLGYSEDIIKAAENQASHFMSQGGWEGMSLGEFSQSD